MRKAVTVLMSLLALAGPAAALDEHAVAPAMVEDRKAVIATVAPRQELLARARIGGIVAEVLVTRGDSVEAGARVALIADEKLALQLQALQARLLGLTAERELILDSASYGERSTGAARLPGALVKDFALTL